VTGAASTIAFSALTALLMPATPAGQSGLGSGLQNTSRQAGALIAVSVLGSVLDTALAAGRLTVPFAILGIADITGSILGLTALAVPAPAAPAR
jgi:MFS transporter, DHA2 family, methylenomycin A resistance protein